MREWKVGPLGWLTRLRGIASTLLLDLGGAIVAFTLVHWILGVLILCVGAAITLLLIQYRYFRLGQIECDMRLHTFCHETRDDIAGLIAAENNDKNFAERLHDYHKKTVQRIANYYRESKHDKTANCAIRIAEIVDGTDAYVTKGRSDGLEPTRENSTRPIPKDKGLPAAFTQKGHQGVFLINSIEKAASSGMWLETPNDSLPDVNKVMIAPINGWEDGEKVMYGLLYITSRSKKFRPRETLALKAMADLLGLVNPLVFDSSSKPDHGGEQGDTE
jgi:hypothetical protein